MGVNNLQAGRPLFLIFSEFILEGLQHLLVVLPIAPSLRCVFIHLPQVLLDLCDSLLFFLDESLLLCDSLFKCSH